MYYFDYNATTPVDDRVVAALQPYLTEAFANPGSLHGAGQRVKAALEQARAQVAALIGAQPNEVIFTGSGSEADNLAIKGVALAQTAKRHLIISPLEHPAVQESCRYLERYHGYEVSYLTVSPTGQVDPAEVAALLRPETLLISLMFAQNETGVLQPVAEVATLARRHGVLLHCDAAQGVGKLPIDVKALGVDLLTIAGHKLYAPKGIGALYVREGVALEPLIHGGGQEGGRRSGTPDVAFAVALGAAAAVAAEELPAEVQRLTSLRDLLWQQLQGALGERVRLIGHPTERLPGTLNVSFQGVVGQDLLAACPQVAASTGSTCHSEKVTPSAVLTAMGVDPAWALGAVRLSLGRFTTEAEVREGAAALIDAYLRLTE